MAKLDKNLMTRRFRELREERGYTGLGGFERLSRDISVFSHTSYGEDRESISVDSLKNYEKPLEQFYSRGGSAPGMSAKKLSLIADFYGVSTDYLTGRTDVRSPDTNLQAVCKYTGLSQEAVEMLRHYSGPAHRKRQFISGDYIYGAPVVILDVLLSDSEFMNALTSAGMYILEKSTPPEPAEIESEQAWEETLKKLEDIQRDLFVVSQGNSCVCDHRDYVEGLRGRAIRRFGAALDAAADKRAEYLGKEVTHNGE